MIPEIGHLSLILSFLMAIALACSPLVARFSNRQQVMGYSYMVLLVQFATLSSAFLILIYSHVVSDFSVLNVVNNSHTAKPLLYKISGVWGNHEGSMLLWSWMLSLVTVSFAWLSRIEAVAKIGVLAVQGLLTAGFLAFILFTSNPFVRVFPPAREGLGLNPLLQDVGLALHPPCLYMGYVGFSLGFSLAVTVLARGKRESHWAAYLKPWILLSWCFLTAGIALGSWWAYRELGWGGFWFWDPVENASLMPWLTGTALLHSLIVLEKRQHLQSWTLLLALTTFALSLLGTFLVRSGVLTSVHSFASDPARGFFILIFLALVVGCSLTLFALRASKVQSSGHFGLLSRESFLLFNNLILLTACATILLGTLYPLFYEMLAGGKLSIGAPYFAATFVPITLPLLGLAAIGSFLAWQQGKIKRVKHGLPALLALLPLAGFYTLMPYAGILAHSAIWLAFWLLSAMLLEWGKRGLWRKQPHAFYAMLFAHSGLAVLVLGVTLAVAGFQEKEQRMQPGGQMEIAGYRVTFKGLHYLQGPNYMLRRATLYVETINGNEVALLKPEVRFYPVEKSQTTESAIHTRFLSDIYAAMGETDASSQATVIRLYYRPGISLLWGGAFLMVMGGGLALLAAYRKNILKQREALF